MAAQEHVGIRANRADLFYEAMRDFRFVPVGPIIAGAGANPDVTLFNCLIINATPDFFEAVIKG